MRFTQEVGPAAFILAWVLPMAIVVFYRSKRIPARWREIRASLLSSAADSVSPAVHYIRLFVMPEKRTPLGWEEAVKKYEPALPANPTPEQKAEALEAARREQKIEFHFNLFHGWPQYVIAIAAVGFTSAIALAAIWEKPSGLLKLWEAEPAQNLAVATCAVWALLGAYVWSIYEIFSRQSTCDLTPEELLWIAVRYLVAIPLGLAVSPLFEIADPKVANAVAFGISAFPLKEVRRLFRQQALKKLGAKGTEADPTREALLSENVDGISNDALARLAELNITTYTDLAYADPLRIMIKTGYSLRQVVQWTDHALLAIYAPKLKTALRDAGLPCALDVKEFYEAHFADVAQQPWRNHADQKCPAVLELSARVGLPVPLLCEIFQRVAADPHVRFIARLWYTGFLPADQPTPPRCLGHAAPSPASG